MIHLLKYNSINQLILLVMWMAFVGADIQQLGRWYLDEFADLLIIVYRHIGGARNMSILLLRLAGCKKNIDSLGLTISRQSCLLVRALTKAANSSFGLCTCWISLEKHKWGCDVNMPILCVSWVGSKKSIALGFLGCKHRIIRPLLFIAD